MKFHTDFFLGSTFGAARNFEGVDRAVEVMARPMRKKEEARKRMRMAIRGGRIVIGTAGGDGGVGEERIRC